MHNLISTERNAKMRLTRLRLLLPALLVAGLAVALSSCGGSSSSSESTSSAVPAKYAAVTAPPDNAKKGGNLTVIAAGDVDYIDPGAEYYAFSYMVGYATQRPLFSFTPGDISLAKPDLAASDAVISNNNTTVTVKIRPDVHYSPPVNRAVTSKDVKYAIERGLLPGVANGYEGIYFGVLHGFKEAEAAAKKDPTTAPDISGIQTPDNQTIVFNLDKPVAEQYFLGALSLPLTAPVPEEYAKKYDAQNPSGYNENTVATGPYMVDSYSPGKEIKLVRNPNWDPNTDVRPAYLDSIDIQEGFSDTTSAAKKILTGNSQVNGDFGVPPEALKLAATQYPDQLKLTPVAGNRYVALNTSKPPFNDINVRKAVIANTDRTALQKTRGGPLAGAIATHFISPNFPGFEEAGGLKGPDLDYIQHPTGDPQLAASYMKKAGFSSGKCEGSNCDITMVADNEPPGSDTAQVVKDQLSQLGFNVNLQPVTHDVMYTKFCDVPKNEPNVCPNVGWLADFHDPQAMLDATFNGNAITSSNNTNWPLLDDKAINDAMEKAASITDTAQRNEAWGKIDDQIMAQAPAIPWLWDNEANVESSNVAGVGQLWNEGVWDLSYTSLK
jgi:peptide/nickel transport system substrate-binding protein